MKNDRRTLCLGDFINAGQRCLYPFGQNEIVEVCRIGDAYLRQVRKLSRAATVGKIGQCRSRLHKFLKSPGAKLAAALLSYPKCENRNRPRGHRRRPKIALSALKAIARDFDMYRPTSEPIRVTQFTKPCGGIRTIAGFGRRSRAGQRLALDAMRAIHGDSELEYARKGRGREVLVEQVLNGVNHKGARYVAETDVKNFFPSVNRQAVTQSGLLPRSVLRAHVLMEGQEVYLAENKIPISLNPDRVGLWQGAIASPYVASKMIESALTSLLKGRGMVYVDNIIIGARTPAEANLLLDTLAQSLAEHPAGPFQLKFRLVSRVGGNHNILGYRVSKDAPAFGGRARAKPSRASICKQEGKLLSRLIFADWDTYGAGTERWAMTWPRQYPLWITRTHAHHLAQINAMSEVWPVARRARKHIKDMGLVFRSFDELRELGDMFAEFLQPEPDWGAVEADIYHTGTTTRVRMSHRSATEYSSTNYIDLIQRFLRGSPYSSLQDCSSTTL